MPIYAGEIQCKSLGMAVQVFSPTGTNKSEISGQPGELVCTMPFPSMPLVLWGDRTGETYRKAYFDKFPGVWHHGDFMAINPETKGIIMLGRRLAL
jgi:acetoacetyl-CoA synthetase